MLKTLPNTSICLIILFCFGYSNKQPKNSPVPQNTPFQVTANGHFFKDTESKPFFWLAGTGWRTFAGPDKESVSKYFKIRSEQGFNIIQVFYTMKWARVNTFGDSAFMNNDPLQLNKNYLAFAQWCTDEAERNDLILAIYIGEAFRIDTWVPRINKEPDAYQFGYNLGEGFRDYKNIIWVLGQDFEGVRNSLWYATAEGINDAYDRIHQHDSLANWNNTLMSYHMPWESSSSLYFHHEPWLDFNMIQSSHVRKYNHHVYYWPWIDWELTPAKPVLDGEPTYEDHPALLTCGKDFYTPHDIRLASYSSVFAGGCGITYGQHSVWRWRNDWEEKLHQPGAEQLIHLKNLMLSRPYFERIPDRFMVHSINVSYVNKIIATRSFKGNYAMVYVPESEQDFELNLKDIKGRQLTGWWYCTQTGEVFGKNGEQISEGFGITKQTDMVTFRSPLRPESRDWVLVIDAENSNYLIPGKYH